MKLYRVVFFAAAVCALPSMAAAPLPNISDVQAAYCQALLANQRDAVRELPGVVGGGPELMRVVDDRVAKLGRQLQRLEGYLSPRRAELDPEPLRLAVQTVSLDQIEIAQAVSDAGCLSAGAGPAEAMACGQRVRQASPAAQRQSHCVDLSWIPDRR